jgi:hypothetical protein
MHPHGPMPEFPRSVHGWATRAVSVADCGSLPQTYGNRSCLSFLLESQVAIARSTTRGEINSGMQLRDHCQRMWALQLSTWIWCAMLLDVAVGHPAVPSLPEHPLLTFNTALHVLHPVAVHTPPAGSPGARSPLYGAVLPCPNMPPTEDSSAKAWAGNPRSQGNLRSRLPSG